MTIVIGEHTTRAFDADLLELTRMVAEMGGVAERQFIESINTLTKRGRHNGTRVIDADAVLDAQQRIIEQKAIETIATRQPMAIDLREIIGTLRIANDLERIGDLAKNICKRAVALNGEDMPRRVATGVMHVTTLVLRQLKDVLDSFAVRDSKKAIDVWNRDKEIDSLYTALFRELLVYMTEDPGYLTFGVQLLFCAKNIERMGDHATNIAEAVYYMVEGRALKEERPKADATSMMTIAFTGNH